MRVRRAAIRLLFGAVLSLVVLELGAMALIRTGVVVAPAPHRGETGFWWHQHPEFGAWKYADSEGPHNGACFDVRYRTNSVGARDRERERRTDGPRVVVLGDSYLEGYGIEEASRLTNVLESRTGIPHLNFAMASFGLYQQLLVYEALAREFDHTAVIASFLPENDFADMDLDLARRFGVAEYTYRPYPVGEPPDVERYDHREWAVRRWLRLHSYAFNLIQWTVGVSAAAEGHASFFYDPPESGVRMLEYLIGELARSVGDRTLVLVLIPHLKDLEHYARVGPDPLSARLAPVARRHGVILVNLLPLMAERARTWSSYYLSCDWHWSHYGNRVAADLVESSLAGIVYPELPFGRRERSRGAARAPGRVRAPLDE